MRYGPEWGCFLPAVVLAVLLVVVGSTPFWFYRTTHPFEPWFLLGGGLASAVILVLGSFRQRGTEVETAGVWEWSGSPIFRKLIPKADLQRVVVREGGQSDDFSSWTVYLVSLEGPRRTVQLAKNFDYKSALKTAGEVGQLLGLPLEDCVAGPCG